MATVGKVGFYAPLKAPDHPTPSGDRRMARLIQYALNLAGYDPVVMSNLRTLDKKGDPVLQHEISVKSAAEVRRIVSTAPDLKAWVTYHVYYKAPDHIGPVVAESLNIPYIILEPSYSRKRQSGPWAASDLAVCRAFNRANVLGAVTSYDVRGLDPWREKVRQFPPFLEKTFPVTRSLQNPPVLLAIGMFRAGDKLGSYQKLSDWLRDLQHQEWQLWIVGDGPQRAEVEALFADYIQRVRFLGEVAEKDIPYILAQAHMLLWPAVNEAYGMALLEAQAAGVPVVSCEVRGVPDVCAPEGAFLVPMGPHVNQGQDFRTFVAKLLDDFQATDVMGRAARLWVQQNRLATHAAARLKNWIEGAHL